LQALARTAMRVAGGGLLANANGGMLSGTVDAQAAEADPSVEADEPQVEDAGHDGGVFDDFDF
jgi:hypothetical protein